MTLRGRRATVTFGVARTATAFTAAPPGWQDRNDMPKNKTHRGAAKRVKISAAGKLLRQRAGKRHLLEKKSSRLTRRLDGVVEVARQDIKRVRKLLGR